ncbi:hypothetical protein C0103_05280 [Staphylococcus aureus]|uniref:Uncharacterized protein n=1 Tax=Staphylococcus aureus (strain MRSA252) TaxID=282458 RepID=A0A7U7ICB6_STAAR|nr:hypothetical protein HMPREF0772_12602 [Staphylococcus aureus subsp. aureus TCH60]AMQ80801.1 hypothetical protein CKU_0520 [Staphylococcus aureus]EEV07039.1 conserved hypothetical protein [Staphylococcus aureus subsp. aureus 65-1322]EEV14921.1 conserved hypothetical protein [Staphylococcus aureus subsp. aureus M876]EFB44598.1 hypothetical protein SARG_00660 [Staphylococcus aureus subsp. aureus C101]EFB47881.1 conserved hypothetical protein [Staphylococcus aureus subsp. aureus C427]EFB50552.
MIVVKVLPRKTTRVHFAMSKVYFVIDITLAHIYKFKHTDFNYLPNHVLCIREYTEDKRKIPSLNR